MTRIVVGVDGSELAAKALRRAVDEARLRDAKLDVVHAVPEPVIVAEPAWVAPPPPDDVRASALDLVDEMLEGVSLEGVDVERVAIVGNAAYELCGLAKGADMLVVGSRGLGGFKGLLLGSVTQQVVAHAPCPILVVGPEGA
jgi:nucleotide-binding universal stress UspA family protein